MITPMCCTGGTPTILHLRQTSSRTCRCISLCIIEYQTLIFHFLCGFICRRLIFLQNQQFIQTDVKLHVLGRKTGKKNKNKSNKSKTSEDSTSLSDRREEVDVSSMDPHHAAVLAALLLNPNIVTRGALQAKVDLSDVPSQQGVLMSYVTAHTLWIPAYLLTPCSVLFY